MEPKQNNLEPLEKLSLEQFKLFSTNALKAYLHVRGKNTEGSHEELVARYITFP